jgi:hypothetical protein
MYGNGLLRKTEPMHGSIGGVDTPAFFEDEYERIRTIYGIVQNPNSVQLAKGIGSLRFPNIIIFQRRNQSQFLRRFTVIKHFGMLTMPRDHTITGDGADPDVTKTKMLAVHDCHYEALPQTLHPWRRGVRGENAKLEIGNLGRYPGSMHDTEQAGKQPERKAHFVDKQFAL